MAKKERETVRIKKSSISREVAARLNRGTRFQGESPRGDQIFTDGDKVKVIVRFGGREMNHTGDGEVLIDKFKRQRFRTPGTMDRRPKLEGKRMTSYHESKNNRHTTEIERDHTESAILRVKNTKQKG